MAAELSYHEKMAKEAQLRAQILWDGRPDPSPNPKILIDPSKRREVESFADKLRGIEPPDVVAERVEYARMDAAATLSRLAGGKAEVLEALQEAILIQDMNAFLDVLDSNKIGTKADRSNLRHFVAKQDRDAIAACIRLLGRRTMEARGFQEVSQVDYGLEVVSTAKPFGVTNRRLHATVFLTGNNVWDPAPFRRPPDSKVLPQTYSAIQLGDAADDWERDQQFHAMVENGANSAMNLMEEAAGVGHLDGRIDGKGT